MKKRRLIALAVCSALSIYSLSGCSFNIKLSFGEDKTQSQTGVFSSPSWSGSSSYVVNDDMERYDYSLKNTLSESQTELYNRLKNMLDEKMTAFDFENITNDDFKSAYYALLYDHPEYIRTGYNYTYSVRTTGDYTLFHADPALFSDDPEVMDKAEQELEEVVNQIVNTAKAQPDPYYMVKYVHDYIIDNTVYDMESFYASQGDNEGLIIASTAYGCLVQHKAVCSGYSAAFQLIMQRLGAECGRINGTRVTESGAHQWNYVCLDGEYYFMDLTWDDPIKDDGQDSRTYDYFLISDRDIAFTHVSDRTLPQPVCIGTRYNFFYYNGLYFDEYNFGSVCDAAVRMKDTGSVMVKFSDPDQLQRAVEDLIEGQRIFELDFVEGGVSYSVSTSGCILSVEY